jgi:fibro-slime domain-containing protein
MKTFLRQYSKPAVSILLALVLMTTTLVTGVIAAGGNKGTVNESTTEAAAVSTAESKTTSVEPDADISADTAVKNTAGSAVNKKKDKKLTGANAKKLTGYTNAGYVKGSWDSWAMPDDSKGHNMTSGYTVSLPANTTYEFVCVADNGDVFKKDMTFTGDVDDYDMNKDATVNAKIKTTIAGNYTFKFKSWNGDNCMRIKITYPANTVADTWTVVGSATGSDTGGQDDALFTKSWDPAQTVNDMTNSNGTWSWTKNNVTLSAGTIKYKVAKNHAWDTSYPSSNATKTVSAAGTYNVTVTYDGNSNVNMKLTSVAKSTLTVGSVSNAVVTATYNGTTVGEGNSISNVPQGAKITVKVTPDSGYKCTAVSPSGTGSGSNWTVTMPGSDTTISATISKVTLKKIYFNNSYTLYGSVYAYVYDKSGSTKTYEYLGSKPGTTMQKLDNSNIWYIEVPEDVEYVEFISGDGKTTGEMSIPWSSYTYPKYTAPYGHNDAPTTANDGTWGNYIYGSNNKRTNEYTVTDGSTMSASNLFTGITATMYDYFVDDEADGTWLTSLSSHVTNYNNDNHEYNDPYKTRLNKALSDYANLTTSPLYGITYPLYFGNLNYKNASSQEAYYYNFSGKANNANYLGGDAHMNDAVTGLSGNKIAGSTIRHYKSGTGVSNENGAPMAMFDEDFLSGENSQKKALATILRTSSFPVRKEDRLGKIYCDVNSISSWVHNDSWKVFAHFYNSDSDWKRVEGTCSNYVYTFTVPSGYKGVKFYRAASIDTTATNSANWKDAGTLPANGNNKYTTNLGNSGTWSKVTGSTYQHTYYEYDSTGGTDNAFITNIDTTNKTANIDYYAGSSNAVKSPEKKTEGFFPFDYNNVISNGGKVTTRVYLKPNSGWKSDNAGFKAVFRPTSGNTSNEAWQTMTYNSTLDLYYADVPAGREKNKLIFARMNSSTSTGWTNKWNDTGELTIPPDNNVVCEITGWDNSSSWKSNNNITVNYRFINGYADSTNRYARDQGFGMKLTIPFTLKGSGNSNGINEDGTPQTFDFSGDDDLWVFVDDKLVLDLGGAHGATTGSIDFKTKTVTASNTQAIASGVTRNGSFEDGFNTNENYVHTMTIYYMERGMFESNLKFGFSFHAIPNQFWIDKKIRTKDIINAGFYVDNQQTGTASNKNAAMTASEERFISNFEASYQDESFTVTHKYGTTSSPSTLASGKNYTIDNDTNTYTTGSDGKYPIKHDLGNAFIGQFDTDDYFNLKESYGTNNKYVYDPLCTVWDQANNNKSITVTGNNSNGYTFQFSPTTTVATAIENTNIKARFENFMKAHTLTLTKELTNTTDPNATFTFQVLFDFDYTGESDFDQYIAYPLYCDVDGERTQLSNTGTITIKAGQVVEIEEIPEKAKVKVVEVLTDTITSYRYGGFTLTKGGKAYSKTDITKGITFTMGDADMTAVASNSKPVYSYSIKYNYAPYVKTYTTQSYTVEGVFTEDEMKTYLSLDGSLNPGFKTAELKRTFINNKAPYEDNFQQTLSFAKSTITDSGKNSSGESLGWNNGVYTCEITAEAKDSNKINVYFNLPYAVESVSTLVPHESATGKVAMITAEVKGGKDIDCFDWYVTSGRSNYNATGSAPVYVKAPLILYTNVNDENTKKYFQYWKVMSQGRYGKAAADITRCYDYEFNLSLFMDCYIEPVYDDTWAQATGNPNPPRTYNQYDRFDPEVQITGDSTKGISVAFLENSRNQYNKDGNGGRTSSPHAADVIYTDFLLSFNKAFGTTQLNTLNANTKKAGVVVEAVNYMDYETGTTTVFDYDKDYSSVEAFTSSAESQRSAIINWLTNGGTRPAGIDKSEFDVKKLDNKNCIQYYYSLTNRKYSDDGGGQLLNTSQNRYKVFRAYAYIGDVNDDDKLSNVKLSDPIYFTVYEAGSKGLDDNKTS